jgi:hypothetical protein
MRIALGFIVVLLLTGCSGSGALREANGGGDCSGIQRAIDALPPSGGQVVVRAGMYTCTQPLVIDRDNVELRGEGPATLLRAADRSDMPVLVMGQMANVPTETRRRIRVSDLSIDGNRAMQHHECRGGPCGKDNALRNNGVSVRRCHDCAVERVTAYSARSGGLVAELNTRRLRVRDFTAFDNHFDGLAAYDTEDSTFSGVHVHDNLAAGLSFDLRFNHNTIGHAIVSRNRSVGIFMRDATGNVFHTLQVRASGEHGILLESPKGAAAGNTFTGIVVAESAWSGMHVDQARSIDNFVSGAQFVRNGRGCISEAVPGMVGVAGALCR